MGKHFSARAGLAVGVDYVANMDGSEQRQLAHFQDEVVMGCLLTARPLTLTVEP